MKINKKTHKKLLKNLTEWRNELVNQINIDLKLIEDAKDVEQIMSIKSDMLFSILNLHNFCLSSNMCYFCLNHDRRCGSCKYGKYNGICPDDNSLYDKISNDVRKLKYTIDEFYWRFYDEKRKGTS